MNPTLTPEKPSVDNGTPVAPGSVISPTAGPAPAAPPVAPPTPPAAPPPAPPTPELPPAPLTPPLPPEPSAPQPGPAPFAQQPPTQPATFQPPVPPQPPLPEAGPTPPMPPVTPQAPIASPGGGKKRLKLFLIILAALLLIGSGAAAAYFGVIVPNKPENVLSAAVVNTLEADQVTTKTTVEGESGARNDKTAYKVDVTTASDSTAKAAELTLNINTSGINFPVEARYVNKNIYVKLGDLTTIAKLAELSGPEAAKLFNNVKDILSDQWVVIDSTLLKQAGANCYMDVNWGFTDADMQLLEDMYKKYPFATITDSASDTVKGKNLSKYTVDISNDQITQFLNDKAGNNLSVVKNLSKCDKSVTEDSDSVKGDHKQTTLTVWVDKTDKRIARVGYTYDKDDVKAEMTTDFSYGSVNIEAPKDAKPAVEVLADLQKQLEGSGLDLSQLLSEVTQSEVGTKAEDAKRKTDIKSLQSQLEAYFAETGHYPSYANLNSASWRAANMKSLDAEGLVDPSNPSKSKELKNSAQANFYAYSATNASGGSCESDPTACASFDLVATLSDGSQFKVSSLNVSDVDVELDDLETSIQ